MRFVLSLGVLALLLVLPALVGGNSAPALSRMVPQAPGPSPIVDVKIVCGDFGQGYTCRRESGAVRRGKMRKIPSTGSNRGSDSSGGGWGWFGGDDDENAPPPPDAAAGASGGAAASGGCPPNSERLGGHCIPYTQTCSRGLAANAVPQVCRKTEEKLVCNFRADGLKDCCCRIYSQF